MKYSYYQVIKIKISRDRMFKMHGVTQKCDFIAGKPERKRPLWRASPRYEGNNKMDCKETGWAELIRLRLKSSGSLCYLTMRYLVFRPTQCSLCIDRNI